MSESIYLCPFQGQMHEKRLFLSNYWCFCLNHRPFHVWKYMLPLFPMPNVWKEFVFTLLLMFLHYAHRVKGCVTPKSEKFRKYSACNHNKQRQKVQSKKFFDTKELKILKLLISGLILVIFGLILNSYQSQPCQDLAREKKDHQTYKQMPFWAKTWTMKDGNK